MNQTFVKLKHFILNHNTKVISIIDRLLCNVCDNSYASPSSLSTHKKTHALDHKSPCDICHKLFRKTYLKQHMKSCTPEKPDIKQVFSCTFCDKKFDKIKSLNRHLQSHDSLIKFSCDICSKDFTLKDSLNAVSYTHLTLPTILLV